MKILGFGNALVDIMLPNCNENVLNNLSLPKGSMTLIDEEKLNHINSLINTMPQSKATGGSAANTINGLANLGATTGFIGKTGSDEIGKFFENDLIYNGIHSHLLKTETPSGRAIAFVTDDSERTFATYLGASIEMKPQDISAEWFNSNGHRNYHYFYVEGYLVQDHLLIEEGMKMAKKAGLKVILDLASFNVVEANLDFLKYLVTEYVDIVFANEEEAKSFTGLNSEDALEVMAENTEIAVVKIGSKGSLIARGCERVKVDPVPANPIDTTGAGDLYAAGFIYGLINNMSLKECGEAASLLAGNVIEVLGAKMDQERWKNIKEALRA